MYTLRPISGAALPALEYLTREHIPEPVAAAADSDSSGSTPKTGPQTPALQTFTPLLIMSAPAAAPAAAPAVQPAAGGNGSLKEMPWYHSREIDQTVPSFYSPSRSSGHPTETTPR